MRILSFLWLVALSFCCLPAATPLNVAELLHAPDRYAGRRIQVKGLVRIVPSYSRLPCPNGVQPCNPILSVAVFLQDPSDSTKRITLYQSGNPYKCSFDMQGNYKCPGVLDNTSVELEGICSKGRQPAGTTGSATPSGGGTPPQSTFTDFYFFDVSPATARQPKN